MNIVQSYITKHRCYTNPTKITLKKLMLHSVGVAQPSAAVIFNQWNNADTGVSVHAFIQPDGTVYQILPWEYTANHSGYRATNLTAIGVEMTEPKSIKYTGGASFTDLDPAATQKHVKACYDTAVELFSYLCVKYNLDPLTAILSHAEGAKQGLASKHADPEHLWARFGFTMDGFRAAVKMAVDKEDNVKTSEITVCMNGIPTKLPTINYNGENYVRLRSLADAQTDDKLTVAWDEKNRAVIISSK
jgi:N-acetyl-anhydromuramyl-L-alanine amidase AmpD